MAMQMTIERLLEWAVRSEWPKLEAPGGGFVAGASSSWAEMADLGCTIRVNRYGVAVAGGATEGPHPAAVLLADILDRLDGMALDAEGVALFTDWRLPADGVALLDEAARAGLATLASDGKAIRALLVRCATLGPLTGWGAEPPRLDWLRDDAGRERWFRKIERAVSWDGAGNVVGVAMVEAEGWDRFRQRPYVGGYRRSVLVPCPLAVARRRAEWQLWRAALDVVYEIVVGGEVVIDGVRRVWPEMVKVLPCALPWRPWDAPAHVARSAVADEMAPS
jgi:hypothetical protein